MAGDALNIGTIDASDIPAALQLSSQAGWNQQNADWLQLLRLWPDSCLGGRVGSELVATATIARYDHTAWLGMVLVHTAFRGRGIGSTMLDAAVAAARAVGVEALGLDATGLGRPIYLKRGFLDGPSVCRLIRSEQTPASLAAVVGHTNPIEERDWPDVLALDVEATGINRQAVLRHIAGEPGVITALAHKGGAVTGFSLARPGRLASHLGPLVGMDDSTALDVATSLTRRCGESVSIDVVGDELPGLAALGFRPQRRLTRMFLGATAFPRAGRKARAYAAVGLELG